MFGTGELIVILCLALLLFGGKKLPEIAKNLGKGIREFKKACQGLEDEMECSAIPIDDEKPPTKHIQKDPPKDENT